MKTDLVIFNKRFVDNATQNEKLSLVITPALVKTKIGCLWWKREESKLVYVLCSKYMQSWNGLWVWKEQMIIKSKKEAEQFAKEHSIAVDWEVNNG